jgi:hypothetical protein
MGLRFDDEEPQVHGIYREGRTGLKTQQELGIEDVLRFLYRGMAAPVLGLQTAKVSLQIYPAIMPAVGAPLNTVW